MYPLRARTVRFGRRVRSSRGCQPGLATGFKRHQILMAKLCHDLLGHGDRRLPA